MRKVSVIFLVTIFLLSLIFKSAHHITAIAAGTIPPKLLDKYNPMPMKISPDARMIPGFKEAVGQLRVGDKAYFYLPYHLGYGERANGPIPAKTDLIFLIEMVEIIKPN